jgi:hypothetical protein
MVPPELNAPIGEQKPLTALAVCAMFERAGGESEDRPSSWGKNSAPESSGDPFLIGIIASTPDLTHTVHPFFRPVFAGLRARLLTAGCDVLVSSRSPLVEPEGDPFSLDRWRRRGVDGLVAMGLFKRSRDRAVTRVGTSRGLRRPGCVREDVPLVVTWCSYRAYTKLRRKVGVRPKLTLS